jgi:hypothetical protein
MDKIVNMDKMKQIKMSEYEKEAREVAKKYGIEIRPLKMEVEFYFDDDEKKGHTRDVYTLLITSPYGGYTFTFRESLYKSTGEAGETIFFDKDEKIELYYSVLACIQKYDVGTIDDFIADFGYDFSCDSYEEAKEKISSIQKTYNAVKEEYKNFSSLFENDIIPDDILEIC